MVSAKVVISKDPEHPTTTTNLHCTPIEPVCRDTPCMTWMNNKHGPAHGTHYPSLSGWLACFNLGLDWPGSESGPRLTVGCHSLRSGRWHLGLLWSWLSTGLTASLLKHKVQCGTFIVRRETRAATPLVLGGRVS